MTNDEALRKLSWLANNYHRSSDIAKLLDRNGIDVNLITDFEDIQCKSPMIIDKTLLNQLISDLTDLIKSNEDVMKSLSDDNIRLTKLYNENIIKIIWKRLTKNITKITVRRPY